MVEQQIHVLLWSKNLEWGFHISFLTHDIDLLDDTNEMPASDVFLLGPTVQVIQNESWFRLLSGKILELGCLGA